MRVKALLALLVVITLTPAQLQPQQASQAVTAQQQAVILAQQAITALVGPTVVSDVTLTGSITQTVGPDIANGTFSLKALGTSASRMDLSLPDGDYTEIRSVSDGVPQGYVSTSGAAFSPMALHNCLTDSVWFFPAFSVLSQAATSQVVAAYIGQETRDGSSVQHLHFTSTDDSAVTATPSNPTPGLTAIDVYLDSVSLLPVAETFYAHPNNNARINIAVEIDFSNYESSNGIQVPYKVQKFVNGSLILDMTAQAVSINTGIPESTFNAN